MSGLRGTIHLRTGQRPPEAHLSTLSDLWCLNLGGDAGGVLPDLTIFGSTDQLRALAHTILAALPVEGEQCVDDELPEHLIRCERCGRTTSDPDLWDPEADTGRVFCDGCWDHRNDDPDATEPAVAR